MKNRLMLGGTFFSSLLLAACIPETKAPTPSTPSNSISSTTWYGSSYASEFASVREKADDDNPRKMGYVLDASNNLTYILRQTGNTYALQDISSLNASIIETTTDNDIYYFNIPSDAANELFVAHQGYLANFEVWKDTEISDNSVNAGELRSRLGIYQRGTAMPYSANRPTTRYDFSKLANNTYTGITIVPSNTPTLPNEFSILDGTTACNNALTFGATATTAVSGSICKTATQNISFNNLVDPEFNLQSQIAANYGVYFGGDATNSVVMLASPDGNAIAIAIAACLDAECQGTFSANQVETYFGNLNALVMNPEMRFSILIKQ